MLLAHVALAAVLAAEPDYPADDTAAAQNELRLMNEVLRQKIEEALNRALRGAVLEFEVALPVTAAAAATAPAEAPR